MDKFKLDGQKLSYHVPRVNDWLQGKNTYPVYIELSPSGPCNQRCRFCAKDFMEYKRFFLDWDILKDRLEEMGRLGVKSIMHAGEGEPLLHEHLEDIVAHGKACGIDQAINTNAVLLDPERAARLLPHATWVRASVDAGTPETYAALHRAKPADYERVFENLAAAARLRDANGWRCTIGVQMILLPDNRAEVGLLAERARAAGVNYMVIKPYSQHPMSITEEFKSVTYDDIEPLQEEVRQLNTPEFQIVLRTGAIQKWNEQSRAYTQCNAMRFWTYIDSRADVWGCCNHHGDERFFCGNLHRQSFQEIWEGEQRRRVVNWVENEFDISCCRINCRMDEVNRYLWDLKNPPEHANFI